MPANAAMNVVGIRAANGSAFEITSAAVATAMPVTMRTGSRRPSAAVYALRAFRPSNASAMSGSNNRPTAPTGVNVAAPTTAIATTPASSR